MVVDISVSSYYCYVFNVPSTCTKGSLCFTPESLCPWLCIFCPWTFCPRISFVLAPTLKKKKKKPEDLFWIILHLICTKQISFGSDHVSVFTKKDEQIINSAEDQVNSKFLVNKRHQTPNVWHSVRLYSRYSNSTPPPFFCLFCFCSRCCTSCLFGWIHFWVVEGRKG